MNDVHFTTFAGRGNLGGRRLGENLSVMKVFTVPRLVCRVALCIIPVSEC